MPYGVHYLYSLDPRTTGSSLRTTKCLDSGRDMLSFCDAGNDTMARRDGYTGFSEAISCRTDTETEIRGFMFQQESYI